MILAMVGLQVRKVGGLVFSAGKRELVKTPYFSLTLGQSQLITLLET